MIRLRRPRPRIAALRLAAAVGSVAFAAAPVAHAAPGDLDSAFGTGGIALTPVGTDDYVRDIAVQPDGKVVAGGAAQSGGHAHFAVARYNADGSLDTSFSGDGKVVTTNLGSSSSVNAVAIQPDGKIVAVGEAVLSGSSPDVALARYNADGSLDTGFSGDGLTTVAMGNESKAWDVVVEPDGNISVAGTARVTGTDRTMVARFTSAGAADSTFGTSGRTTTLIGDSSYAMGLVRQADGKLVVAGGSDLGGISRIALARYGTSGTLDSGFGTGGTVVTQVGTGSSALALVADPDGKLVVAGGAGDGVTHRSLLARYGADGTLDSSFGTAGVTQAPAGGASYAWGLARQADGAMVAAGQSTTGDVTSIALTRVNTDGSLDSGFGSGGSVVTSIGGTSYANDVAVLADGRILAAGFGIGSGAARQFALAAYVASAPAGGGDPGPVDPGPVDPGPVDPGPVDPGTGDPGTGDPGTIDTGSGSNGGGLLEQIVSGDSLGLIPPDVKPIVLPTQPLRMTDSGMVPVRLKCIDLPDVTCKGTVIITVPSTFFNKKGRAKLSSARRRKMVRIGRKVVTIKAGQTVSANVALTSAARRTLAAKGAVRAEVTASMQVGTQIRASRRTFNLRAPKKKKKSKSRSRR